jgi:chaperonin GroES
MIKPIGDMVLVKKAKDEEKVTKSGIVLAGFTSDSGPSEGEVIAVGPGERNYYTGELVKLDLIEVGTKILFPQHAGTEVEDDGDKYILLSYKNIIAVKE